METQKFKDRITYPTKLITNSHAKFINFRLIKKMKIHSQILFPHSSSKREKRKKPVKEKFMWFSKNKSKNKLIIKKNKQNNQIGREKNQNKRKVDERSDLVGKNKMRFFPAILLPSLYVLFLYKRKAIENTKRRGARYGKISGWKCEGEAKVGGSEQRDRLFQRIVSVIYRNKSRL